MTEHPPAVSHDVIDLIRITAVPQSEHANIFPVLVHLPAFVLLTARGRGVVFCPSFSVRFKEVEV